MIRRILSIISDNYSTFYDYSTGIKQRIWHIPVLIFVSGSLLSLAGPSRSDEFLSSVITVQAILIGFCFSVMFFLVQSENKTETKKAKSIEEKLKEKQLETLSKEIFWNVSYFSTVSIFSLVLALLLMIPDGWGAALSLAKEVADVGPAVSKYVDGASDAGHAIVSTVFFYLLVDSGYTFARLVGRVNFLFEEKMPSISS